MPQKKQTDIEFVEQALAIEVEEAKKAGLIGYLSRALVQATLPHSKRDGVEFTRRNGLYTLTIMTPSHAGGLPYGSIPRLLNYWITTEAVKTKSPYLTLGPTLSSFMAELDIMPTGGRWGSIVRLKDQMTRLFSSSISCIYEDQRQTRIRNVTVVEEANLWWSPKSPDQATLWKSTLELNKRFFDELIQAPVPIHIDALKLLKKSPMALDIYSWLTYRMSYLRDNTCIPWKALEMQFGSEYTETRYFKRAFCRELKKVLVIYRDAKVRPVDNGLLLKPSNTHIPRIIPSK